MQSPADNKPPSRQRPCDVGIVFALSIEAGGFEDRLSGILAIKGPPFHLRQGAIAGQHVAVLVSGPGRDAAAHGTEVLLAGHRPRLIIAAGFAGGVNPEVQRDDLVLADRVADVSGRELILDASIAARLRDETAGLHIGRLLTVDRIICTPAEKRALGEKHQALAVDMETLAVAEVCQREGVTCLAVRVISDSIDDELPPDIERLMQPKPLARRIGVLAGTVLRRPSSIKDLWKLKEGAILSSDRLGKFLQRLITQLP